jgi:hypothetical protein
MKKLIRTIHPEVKVLDAAKGLVEYVASDETVDSYREVVRADGWRFTNFAKNSPFVDSHDYNSVDKLLGKVVDFAVKGKKLIETVQWAVDVADNRLAQLGFKMTEAGYLKAVSVGFFPTKMVSKWDSDPLPFVESLQALGLAKDSNIRAVYLEQEQVELSACIIGANPNALARSYKAGILTDADLDYFSDKATVTETDNSTEDPAVVELSRQRARTVFMLEMHKRIKSL